MQIEVLTGKVSDFTDNIHALAELNTIGGKWSIEALKESIKETEQQEPIKVYRGKVVDGRNRLAVLALLGKEEVLYVNIPNNYNLKKVKEIVLATDTGKTFTKTQGAIKAYRLWKDHGYKIEKASALSQVGVSTVKNVTTLMKLGGSDLVDRLFNGEEYKLLPNSAGISNTTDSITAILKDLKIKNATVKTDNLDGSEVEYDSEDGDRKAETIRKVADTKALLKSTLKDYEYNSLFYAMAEDFAEQEEDDKVERDYTSPKEKMKF